MTKVYVKIGLNLNDIECISTSWTADTQSTMILDDDVLDVSKIDGYVGYVAEDGQQHLKFDEDRYNAKLKEQQKEKALEDGQKMKQELSEIAILSAATDEQAFIMRYLYPEWSSESVKYKKNNRLIYNDKFYKVLQDHTSQSDWTPDTATSLFVEISDPNEEWPEFKQPTGAHDAYSKGDKITFEGKHYTSLIDANTYSPSAYPSGWQLVE